MMSDAETLRRMEIPMFPNQLEEVMSQSMRSNLRKSPAIRFLTSTSCGDICSLLDCAAATQSRANRFGGRKGLKTCDF
jgi:hypothetical protein